ncbi:MAG TPA: efflux RND transporter permease subunit [Terriglobales bacterium]|nr:efflux RND transporter permease subunit [Terriglobales bacterium]
MSIHHKSDAEIIATTHNVARFFTEHRQVALVLLLATFAWGWFGYHNMPKRKDPDIPVRVAAAQCQWPGATAEQVEQLVTRPIEQAVALNLTIRPPSPSDFGIRSMSFPGLSVVYIQLDDNVKDKQKEFADINLKLNQVKLPRGAGPIQFNSNFGDTAALMLTVSSPIATPTEVAARAVGIRQSIEQARAQLPRGAPQPRVSIVYAFPMSVAAGPVRSTFESIVYSAAREGTLRDLHFFDGPGYVGVDASSSLDDAAIRRRGDQLIENHLHRSELYPDAWRPAIIRGSADTEARLQEVAGAKYSYRQLDNYTDLIQRTMQGVPETSSVTRSGVLPEAIYLDYSQQRLAQYGYDPSKLKDVLNAQNITLPAGSLEVGPQDLIINPSGLFPDAQAIGNVIVGVSSSNSPVYLRDLVNISRSYQSPPTFLNYLTWRDPSGKWLRSRAITLAINMRSGQQIQMFGQHVQEKLDSLKPYLPDDLVILPTSSQPVQVKEQIDLFMDALYEAIGLVVVVSLIGFWEWRSALLMAISIPITLAMTFGIVYVLGIDIQQVSVASLIIALGLLVDDPVVAGDSIKRMLAEGQPRIVAPWLGPTKIATAILYATITNIVAYLPFLMLPGTTGEFIYSLPVVMTAALVSSRLASMTFIPLLGYYLLRPDKEPEAPIEKRRTTGFTGKYAAVAKFAIEHRWKVAISSLAFLALGGFLFSQLKSSFFPDDVQYWSYVDVWLPNDANFDATNRAAQKVEQIIREQAAEWGRKHPQKDGSPAHILKYVTTWVGGGSPRFWFSVSPQPPQLNYAQVLVQLTDKEITPDFVNQVQPVLSARLPGIRCDYRQLQTNPVNYPVEIRVVSQADVSSTRSAEDIAQLRKIAAQVEDIVRSAPEARRVRNEWQDESFQVILKINPDRANLAGITNLDVANSATSAMNGTTVTSLQEGDRNIPVIARLQMSERARLSDIQNLYVYSGSSEENTKVPLAQISDIQDTMATNRIIRIDHFREMSIFAFPAPGHLASEITNVIVPKLKQFEKTVPPGYKISIGGEYNKQQDGFHNLAVVLAVSVLAIYLALLFQFNNAIKPLLVFAAAPYGVAGAILALWVMRTSFGFMAFLGIASLIGVIVSHVIVLFDFIEEMHAKGEPFEEAVIDAGIIRLRPVMITVGATVLALFPLAMHGGPLWQPLCYAQIGGLTVATFITLLMVPVLYSILVLDLKILTWDTKQETALEIEPPQATPVRPAPAS